MLEQHKNQNEIQFNLAEPNIVKVENYSFLVLTVIKDQNKPSVCFYKLEESGHITYGPYYEQEGAEMFLGIVEETVNGKKENLLRFLTNEKNLDRASTFNNIS